MFSRNSVWMVVLGASMLVGCERQDEASKPATPQNGQAAPAVSEADRAKAAEAVDTTAKAAGDAAQTAAAKSEALSKDAQAKLDQILAYIKDKKFDLADSALKQLEDAKASLPEAIQSKISAARTALNAAKAGELKLPSLPGGK